MDLKELSSIELNKIVEEFQPFVGGKIDQIYMPDKKDILLQLHIPAIGKKIIRIRVPNFIYVTTFKPEGKYPPGYCIFLRKRLKNARIKEIKQIPNERIVLFTFTTKEKVYELYVELFLKGNILLCENNKIISPLDNQKWSDRTIRGGIDYTYTKKESSKLTEKLDMPIAKFLAIEMNIGGKYAEEVCKRTKVDKNTKTLNKKEISDIEKEIKNMFSTKPKGFIYKDKNEVKAITPFEMKIYSNLEVQEIDNYNDALNLILTDVQKKTVENAKNSSSNLKKNKYQKIIDAQTKQLNSNLKKIKETTEKGEAIYNNYNLIQDILTELRTAREKYSWKEIQEKLKGHKIIKKIVPKEGKIIIDI